MASQIVTGKLQINDLAELIALLRKYGVSYYQLGLFLGLSPVRLDKIEAEHRNNECTMEECLKAWLKETDDVQKKGGSTVHSLIAALRKMEEKAAAKGIDIELHPACAILDCYLSDSSLFKLQLAEILQYEGIIKRILLLPNEAIENLKGAVKDSVCADHHNLQKFAAVLQKMELTAEKGANISKDYKKAFPEAISKMVIEPAGLIQEYDSTVAIATDAMSCISADQLKKFLQHSYLYLRPQLHQCETINDILDFICDRCKPININLLANVAEHFKVEDAIKVIQEYKEFARKFCENTPLRSCLEKKFASSSSLKCEEITIFVNQSVDNCTLRDVINIIMIISEEIFLVSVRDDSSFTITCSFPLILSEVIIAASLQHIDILKGNGVQRLTIGHQTVLEVGEFDKEKVARGSVETQIKQLLISRTVQLLNKEHQLAQYSKEEFNENKILLQNEMLLAKSRKSLVEKDEKIEKLQEEISKKAEQLKDEEIHIYRLNEEISFLQVQLRKKEHEFHKGTSGNEKELLSIEDLAEVYDLLRKNLYNGAKNHQLGVWLGLSSNTLNAISENCKDNDECLLECLKAWLRHTDVRSMGGPTIHSLIYALREVGENSVADKIDKEKHPACAIFARYASAQSLVEALPQLSIKLCKEGVIRDSILLPLRGNEKVILKAVKDGICADYHNLEKLATVLQKMEHTEVIGNVMMDDYVKQFPNEMSEMTEMTDDEDELRLNLPMLDEFQSIRDSFTKTVDFSFIAIKAIPKSDLREYLQCNYTYLAPQMGPFEDADDELIIYHESSPIDVGLLEGIASHFNIKEVKLRIQEYKKEMKEFHQKFLLQLCLDKKFSKSSPFHSKKIRFFVDESIADYTFNDVKMLVTKAFADYAPHVEVFVIKRKNN